MLVILLNILIFIKFDVQYDDIGVYECQAQTQYHTSTANCTLEVSQFDVIVTPSTLEIEIGNTAIFTCEISPEIPSWLELAVSYRWTRGDNVEISQNAVGVNTKTLTVVSFRIFASIIRPEK